MNKRNVLKRKGLSKFSLTYTFDHSKPIKMDKTTKKAAFLPNILQKKDNYYFLFKTQ